MPAYFASHDVAAALSVSTPWVEQGYGAGHRRLNPYENVMSTDTVSRLGVLWQISASGLGSAPAVVDGRVHRR